MAGFFFTKEEQLLLRGAPDLVQRLYVMQLRPRMDINTKRVGERPHAVTWSSLARFLSTDPFPGIKAVEYSAQQIRRACEHLIELGLVIKHSTARTLVLELPEASVFNKADRLSSAKADSLFLVKADSFKSSVDTDLSDMFAYLDGKADLLIEVNPDSLAYIKPDSLTIIKPKPDSLNTSKPDSIKQALAPCGTKAKHKIDSAKPTAINTQKPTDIISTLPDLTLHNNNSTGGLVADPVLRWRKYFKNLGFSGKRLNNTGCLVLYRDWDARGITEEVMADCLVIAQAKLDGEYPDTPEYLRTIVDDYLARSNQNKASRVLKGYQAPFESLSAFLCGRLAVVVAPSEDQAKSCVTTSRPGFKGKIRKLDPSEPFYIGEDVGESTVSEVISLWVKERKPVPSVVRWLDG